MAIYSAINATGNVTGFMTFMEYGNTVTSNYFGVTIILLTWIIAFVAMKQYTTERAVTAASFMTVVLTILFYYAGLVQNYILIPVVVLGTLSLFVSLRHN